MWFDLGCNVLVNGFKVKNTHNSIMNDFSSKSMKVTITDWYSWYEIELLKTDLPDSREQVSYTGFLVIHYYVQLLESGATVLSGPSY